MKNSECKIVSDLLPLYIDGVVSDETKKFIEKHLNECETCREEYKKMSDKLYIPNSEKVNHKDAEMIKSLKKKFKNKKFKTTLFSILATLVVLISIFLYMSLHQIPITYSENQMDLVENSGELYLYYNGDYSGSKQFSYSKKYGDKTSDIVYLYSTPIDEVRNKLNKDKKNKISKIYIGKTKDITKLYYGEFKVDKDSYKDSDFKKMIENKKLLWSEN